LIKRSLILKSFKISGIFFIFIFTGLVYLKIAVPAQLKTKLIAQISENCKTCKIDVKSLSVSLLRRSIILKQITLEQGIRGDSFFEAHIPRIVARVSVQSLFSHLVKLNSVLIEHPRVVLSEGIIQTPHVKKAESEASAWSFECDRIVVSDGSFTYFKEHQDRHPDKKSTIRVNQIQAVVKKFGSLPGLRDQVARAHAVAVLENSGKVDLEVDSVLFSKTINVDVDLLLARQNLETLNPYFDVNDGVHLNGELIRGQSKVSIRDKALQGWVRATYNKLNVKFKKMPDQSATKVFFSNLLSSLKISSKNTNKKRSDHERRDELHRKSKESLVSFILRGMKVAALKVVTD